MPGYYWRFIKGFGIISIPLTNILKKNNYVWTQASTEAFNKLKEIMSTTPLLPFLEFAIEFTLEIDSCDERVRAVLIQLRKVIAYMSKNLSG